MNRVALLTECKPYQKDRTFSEQLIAVGGNTGNNAYITALKDIYNADHVNYGELDRVLQEDLYDTYIVGNLSWIVENTSIPEFYYNAFKKIVVKGKKFVPISVGTQTSEYTLNFKYHPLTLKFLREISEQALIGCRGYYTAELLRKNGVTNVEAIGCPSLFHTKNPNFSISKKDIIISNLKVATGITPWPTKNMNIAMIKKYFRYIDQNGIDFIEQANTNWIDFISKSDNEFKQELTKYLSNYSKIFFNIEEWRKYSKELAFSFGARFHGNVIPLLEKIPALFITIDARTKEMCEYFKLPAIDIKDFNFDSSIQELYEITDYTDFNKNYNSIYRKFEQFSSKNNLVLV